MMKRFVVLFSLVFLAICKLGEAEEGAIEGSICQANEHIGKCVHINAYPKFQQTYRKQQRSVEDLQFLKSHYCGVSTSSRIVDGQIAELDDFPWMALFQYRTLKNKTGVHCGGALITKRYVLSAAHCFRALPSRLKVTKVILGEWDYESNVDCMGEGDEEECAPPVQEFDLNKTIVHEQYSPLNDNVMHDIALVRLSGEAKYNRYVKPICLPEPGTVDNEQLYTGDLTVAGWGKTESEIFSRYKLYAELKAYNFSSCREIYARATGRYLVDGQICAKGNDKQDSCNGDSGGPLMKRTDSRYYVSGVVSFGPIRCGEQLPGVYTKVEHYYQWIVRNIAESDKEA